LISYNKNYQQLTPNLHQHLSKQHVYQPNSCLSKHKFIVSLQVHVLLEHITHLQLCKFTQHYHVRFNKSW